MNKTQPLIDELINKYNGILSALENLQYLKDKTRNEIEAHYKTIILDRNKDVSECWAESVAHSLASEVSTIDGKRRVLSFREAMISHKTTMER